jgi:uncharacterized protein (DUF849 family)
MGSLKSQVRIVNPNKVVQVVRVWQLLQRLTLPKIMMKTVRKRKKRKRNPNQTIEAVRNLIMGVHIQKEMACYHQRHITPSQENYSQIF